MRLMAVVAPLLMLCYGLLRWVDGWDGDRGNGPAWDVGHVAFFAAMVLFAVLAVQMRGLVVARRPAPGRAVSTVASTAAGAAVFGVGCFLWVIIGDLFDSFRESVPLPDALETTGPALFGLGVVVLMGLLAGARRLPWWSPALFLAGFLAIPVDLDLLPFAAATILIAFLPLARPAPSTQTTTAGTSTESMSRVDRA
ncbi:hypothetical protein [Paractinoplanes atraurantiacus]|uniref:Uncharacterized protein n=1 Tax=Paractinoplanes atraurantiacus TaxID=1036182 RepID=A0A285I2T1_9ACTN|nr:hypothetical protein [Actinoplanes atraurantiacus]SNY41386.1 hypothetical protein SAMN05421748_106160 [Actinoplanes atraurantiacus]